MKKPDPTLRQFAAEIFVGVTDHLDPELQAMILAKYSRSYASVMTRIPADEEDAKKVKAALRLVYINYGHRSVGQLGTTTIFFEGVSMLAALALTDSKLFNGQESSTRYIPYDEQPAIDMGESRVRHWQEVWRLFYKEALQDTIKKITAEYPVPEDETRAKHLNAIKARAFDICGGILPAGFTTSVGFCGTFDTLNDHLTWMIAHPLHEVRDLAEMAAQELALKYPNAAYSLEKLRERGMYRQYGDEPYSDLHISAYYFRKGGFAHDVMFLGRDGCASENVLQRFCYTSERDAVNDLRYPVTDQEGNYGIPSNVQLSVQICGHPPKVFSLGIEDYKEVLEAYGMKTRKKYECFPEAISSLFRFRITSKMDMRSYRDMHRHRNGSRPIPLLEMNDGLHPYYVENLSQEMADKFISLAYKQEQEIKADYPSGSDTVTLSDITEDELERASNFRKLNWQYAIPMAALVPYYYECDLNQLLYMLELRTDKTVHQSLRIEMMAVYERLKAMLPELQVHVDLSPNNFSLKRGGQTFETT